MPTKRNRTVKGKRFPYDPLMLGATIIGWVMGLGPKIQAIVSRMDPYFPAQIYAEVCDHLFGTKEGEESQLWTFLMSAKPPGISQDLHEEIRELVECIGRISADIVEGVAERVWLGRERGDTGAAVFKDCRTLIDQSLDEHELENAIQAVLDA